METQNNVSMSVAQATSCDTNIRYVNFSGVVGKDKGVTANIRTAPSLSAAISRVEPNNKTLSFDAWGYGDTVNDLWENQPDARWFKLKGENLWVASAIIYGLPPGNPSRLPSCGSTKELRMNAALDKLNGMYSIPDPDGNYRGECVSFAKRFTQELGVKMGPMGGTGGAKFGFINFNQPGLSLSAAQAEKINFTGREQPLLGDIIFFDGTQSNGYGHVAVVQSVLGNNRVIIQESNGNAKAPDTYVTRYELNLNQSGRGLVMGWLRLKL